MVTEEVIPPAAAALLGSRTARIDGQVADAYEKHLAPAFPSGLSLLAVGGYGRRELFPHSDIDLLILTDTDVQDERQRTALSAFLRSLWDAGMRLSQSVRSMAECTRLDPGNVELSISLLDARYLAGDSGPARQLLDRLPGFFSANRESLLSHLCQMTQARHARFHNTIYHLEPNIKEGPGGLRDLHFIRWASQLRGDRAPQESEAEIHAAQDFLHNLRCLLHTRASRDQNVVGFPVQELFGDGAAAWMCDLYRHLRIVQRHAARMAEECEQVRNTGLLRSFRDWRTRLSNAEFTVSRNRILIRNPDVLTADLAGLLRLFDFAGRHGIPLSADAHRRVKDAVQRGVASLAGPAHWPAFRAICGLPHADAALRGMHETGLLEEILPAWKQIECLVVRDFYHRYTVDEHTLVAIGHLCALRDGDDPSRRRFANLLAETRDPALLVLALLFHDVGKSNGLEGHARASAREAEEGLRRLGAPDADRRMVSFLVDSHLVISASMNSRDLSDPATAADLAAKVETLEKLNLLTLLTWADISAVNPDAMTPWRLEQLWLAFLAAHRELTKDLDAQRIHLRLTDEKAEWLEGFPTRYLRTHTSEQIDDHLELARRSREEGVALTIERASGAWRLTVVTHDRPGLLAGLAGTVSSFGMNIVRAEAFANSSGSVLDSIVFEDPIRTLDLNPGEVDRLKGLLTRVVLGKEDVERLLRGRARPKVPPGSPAMKASVSFDNAASDGATLVEIVAMDRPGLLYDLARTFSAAGCSIEVVLIDTEAHKALDVFYITRNSVKLSEAELAPLQEQLLQVCSA